MKGLRILNLTPRIEKQVPAKSDTTVVANRRYFDYSKDNRNVAHGLSPNVRIRPGHSRLLVPPDRDDPQAFETVSRVGVTRRRGRRVAVVRDGSHHILLRGRRRGTAVG